MPETRLQRTYLSGHFDECRIGTIARHPEAIPPVIEDRQAGASCSIVHTRSPSTVIATDLRKAPLLRRGRIAHFCFLRHTRPSPDLPLASRMTEAAVAERC